MCTSVPVVPQLSTCFEASEFCLLTCVLLHGYSAGGADHSAAGSHDWTGRAHTVAQALRAAVPSVPLEARCQKPAVVRVMR